MVHSESIKIILLGKAFVSLESPEKGENSKLCQISLGVVCKRVQ